MKNNNFTVVLAGNGWPCSCLFIFVYESRAERYNKDQVSLVPI